MARAPASNASLYDRFAAVEAEQGLCAAIITVDQTITFLALKTAVDNLAGTLATRGVGPGTLIGVRFGRPELYMMTLLAANRLGGAIALADKAESQRMAHPPNLFLSDAAVPANQRQGASVVDDSWFQPRPQQKPAPRRAASDNIVYTFGTSGSTGQRKFLRISEKNLVSRLPSQLSFADPHTRLMMTIGLQTAISTEVHLATLLAGGSIVTLPPDPQKIPFYVDLFGVTTLLTTPLLLGDLAELNLPREIYRTLDRIAITGAAATRETIERARERMCSRVILSYGSTEKGGTARFEYSPEHHQPGIVGQIVPEATVEIVDPDGAPLPRGEVGAVRIRRDNVLSQDAYAGLTDDGNERFNDGWFYSGDLGRFDEHDNLIITGRDDNVLNAGGNKYALERIEVEIEGETGHLCMVMPAEASGNKAVVDVVLQTDERVNPDKVREHVRDNFSRLDVGRIYTVGSLPMSEAGKKDRLQLTRMLEDTPGDFRIVQAN